MADMREGLGSGCHFTTCCMGQREAWPRWHMLLTVLTWFLLNGDELADILRALHTKGSSVVKHGEAEVCYMLIHIIPQSDHQTQKRSSVPCNLSQPKSPDLHKHLACAIPIHFVIACDLLSEWKPRAQQMFQSFQAHQYHE